MVHVYSVGAVGLHVKPMYQRLVDKLTARILDGTYPVGMKLPAENDFAQEFDISMGTMRKALDTLEAAGLVDRRQGQGTFVCDPTKVPFKMALGREQAEELLRTLRKADGLSGDLQPLVQSLNNYVLPKKK